VDGHYSRVEPVEDSILELEDKIQIKGKTEELLVKQFKTCKRNIPELMDSIKRPNLSIMGIEEGEEVQAKGIHIIFNKIVTENSPSLEKVTFIQIQEPAGQQTDLTKIQIPHDILSLKQQAQRIEKEY
jgi:hypothetical protein